MGLESGEVVFSGSIAGHTVDLGIDLDEVEDAIASLGGDVDDLITVSELASELGVDRTTMRRYIRRRGIETTTTRSLATHWQEATALTPENADLLRQLRHKEGYIPRGTSIAGDRTVCQFYCIQVMPDIVPGRVRLGVGDPAPVLDMLQYGAPTARVTNTWQVRRSWVPALLECATMGCTPLPREVYQCEDFDELVARIEGLLGCMPRVEDDSGD